MDMQYIRVNNLLRGKQLNILCRNTGLPSLYSRRVHAAEQNGRGDVIELPTENIHVKCNERCRLHGRVPPVPHQQRIYYECLPRFDKKNTKVSLTRMKMGKVERAVGVCGSEMGQRVWTSAPARSHL